PGEAAAALEAAFDEIARLESVLSDWKTDSELSRLNREAASGPFACSGDLYDFVAEGVRLWEATSGAFDLTVAPLVALWDLRGEGRAAGDAELAATMRRVGSARLRLDGPARTVFFQAPGMGLDPGALGKGYALDAAARVLRARGVKAALLDFGGQLLAIGAPAGRAGWEAAVAHPLRRDEAALTVILKDESIATSGNAERGLIVDGRQMGHVLDPATGRPIAWRGSASVIAASAAEADALSTALLVMGPDRGLAWAAGREGLTPLFLEEDERGELVVRPGPGLRKRPAAPWGGAAAGIAGDGRWWHGVGEVRRLSR
ncbi:MAG TPA: FAD:protein FMN transferase, partial [Candidatus Polarisedimenticolia bacterium]|nr:FAD:protein FMN transferase [Candidatus Polarisedimenticolia bacterium]